MENTWFKSEIRLVWDGLDTAKEAWFECVGRLYLNGVSIPTKYEYRPGLSPCQEDTYFFEIFKESETCDLIEIAEFLYRYVRLFDKD